MAKSSVGVEPNPGASDGLFSLFTVNTLVYSVPPIHKKTQTPAIFFFVSWLFFSSEWGSNVDFFERPKMAAPNLLWIEVIDVLHDDLAQDVLLAGQRRILVHGHHVGFHGGRGAPGKLEQTKDLRTVMTWPQITELLLHVLWPGHELPLRYSEFLPLRNNHSHQRTTSCFIFYFFEHSNLIINKLV